MLLQWILYEQCCIVRLVLCLVGISAPGKHHGQLLFPQDLIAFLEISPTIPSLKKQSYVLSTLAYLDSIYPMPYVFWVLQFQGPFFAPVTYDSKIVYSEGRMFLMVPYIRRALCSQGPTFPRSFVSSAYVPRVLHFQGFQCCTYPRVL